ncbi:uncharacterized protein Z520_07795 [Fonsecaea multimorphosa CBS 102226]|uniref:Serine/threonine-protein kinase RIO1 n=1 Tax=Fonsecaea multimorphosa CBS 102226 TaxID=1442371 RepID=A0A0D2K0P0_9EURO|nr:uncharacterized protein Z520_07795 [Fonsecaea multimorphosa CBS 102226]KIX96529.1 hypothetical protein Z520_07795 [Fonsecaea multimorphosa CBS 102226]OAL28029.1 hypothetical protein AYO22_03056 [Fonsecaea multimorphosa]
MSSEPTRGIADGLTPSHTYVPNQGYVSADVAPPRRRIALGQFIQEDDDDDVEDDEGADAEEDDDGEEDLYAEAVDRDQVLDPEDLANSNPADLTKAYNRRRRLDEATSNPSIPSWQYPKANPQQKSSQGSAANMPRAMDALWFLEMDEVDNRPPTNKDKSERATAEQVLDPKTRMILFSMIQKGIVSEVHGTISTGKEANVYHAVAASEDDSQEDTHVAIKVYKTAILVFKDREKYVTGEHRFRKGHRTKDNRAMVKMWAEKEMRNLKRIHAAGIPCPEPLYLRRHVLGMNFIGNGKKGKAAPRLKDLEFEGEDERATRWRTIYIDVVAYVRIMLQVCHLVHADLSEYNILYHEDKPYIIDVSQSVEGDHPRSLDFLRMDIKNVTDFFRRKGVNVLSERKMYEFVTKPEATTTTGDQGPQMDELRKELDRVMAERTEDDDEEDEVDNQVFRQQYIPQTLDDVYDAERDAETLQTQGRAALVYKDLLAPLRSEDAPAAVESTPVTLPGDGRQDPDEEGEGGAPLRSDADASDASAASKDDDSDVSDSTSSSFSPSRPRGKRFQDKEEKRQHKQKVKEEKREKRSQKMPKATKKKLVKESARHQRSKH